MKYIRIEKSEALTRRYSMKKVFLETLQNSLENACVGVSFLIKLQASGLNSFGGASKNSIFWILVTYFPYNEEI